MESRISIFILCLLYVTRASEMQSEEIEFKERFPRAEDPSRLDASLREPDGAGRQSANKLRDKRALGLLLSGLAQIFGYTVTPIQVASLPNPTNATKPAMSSSLGQQTASTQPMSMNATAPKQQETIRFTGVVNFGNNTDIIGHLQRYEQIFHGRQNNATNAMMMTSQPASMPMPPAKISVDPTTNSATRPPLLAPFFVKIPLPIAPDLPPATIPIENFKSSVPTSAISIMSESNKSLEVPMRKEQETIYRNNENTERLMVEEKDIYDEKDVMKPMNHRIHQLHEPSLRHKQEEHIEKLQEQKERTNCDMNKYHRDEINERNRNREEEIAHRNREHASNSESTEEKTPADDDEENEESAERHEERTNQANKSKQPPREDESEEVEDDPDQQSRQRPENFDKYIEVSYNQQLPIGDYFHEGDPEMIRDSYGEILNDKKLEDDRIGYINMFKHPLPEDASGEDEKEPPADGYDEHLIRLQKLREEYALPKNKYEEYDLNDENEAERDERAQNRTSRPKIQGRVRGKEDDPRARIPPGVKNILRDDDGNAKSQEEIDLVRHVPLIVPIRYIDANNRVQQATTQQLSYEESDKSANGRFSEGNVDATQTLAKEKLTPLIGLPERPRKLHEGEHKELQVWPPPFDYAFDNTAPTNTIVPPNSQSPSNYQYVKNIANHASSEHSSEQPSGFLVVVGNSAHPYRYPYNVYYFPNENTNPQSQDPQNTEATYQRSQVYVPRQNTNQQFIRVNSNLSEYLNGTTRDRYHQPHEAPTNVPNRYRYIFNERAPEAKESINVDLRNQIPNIENWSSRIYQPQAEQSSPVLMQVQNVRSLHQNFQGRPSNSRYSRSARSSKNPQKDQGKNDGEMKSLQPIPTNKSEDDGRMKILKPVSNKPFDDPQSAHDFFGFNKDDYSFAGESSDALKVEENGKIMKESDMLLDPVYHHDNESVMKHADEPENDTEKAKVTEYRNKVTTLKISEQRQLTPNGPIHYEKREEIQRRNELENRMAEILENLKTRLLVE